MNTILNTTPFTYLGNTGTLNITNNELHLKDGTFYDLSTTGDKRVLQGLKLQLEDGSLTQSDYDECINLIKSNNKQ